MPKALTPIFPVQPSGRSRVQLIDAPCPNWYLMLAKPKQDARAIQQLSQQGVRCYQPKFAVKKTVRGVLKSRVEPLFPRYLFVYFDPFAIPFTQMRSTIGIQEFVKTGQDPVIVPGDLVYFLSLKTQAPLPEALQLMSNLPKCGQKVAIKSGPYQNCEAIFDTADGQERAILLINFLHQQVRLSVPWSEIKSLD